MGPYRTRIDRPTRTPAPPPRDHEDLIVHAIVLTVGVIGVLAGFVGHDFHAGFALASLLVLVGLVGVARRPT
jgi:hypothetical protein